MIKIILKVISVYFNALTWLSPQLSAKQSFYLFAYPFKSILLPEQQDFLSTSDMFQLEVDGNQVQYYAWGAGKETILLVHGWRSNSSQWDSFVEALDKGRFTIYAFDAPGHGNSEGKICTFPHYEKSIKALLEEKGSIDHFIAHSIGSFACASFMYHSGYRVQSYVSLASPFSAVEFMDNYKKRLTLSDRSHHYLSDFFKRYIGISLDDYSHSTFSKKVKPCRSLIIHDKQDKATSYHNAIKIRDLLKAADIETELFLTEGLNHNLRGEEVVNRVLDYLGCPSLEESLLN